MKKVQGKNTPQYMKIENHPQLNDVWKNRVGKTYIVCDATPYDIVIGQMLMAITVEVIEGVNGVIAEIDKSTCLVHPALEETFGNILLEGMARRVVVIGGEHSGAVPFVLQNGKCGILCDVTSVESIVNAMEKSLDEKTAIQLLNDGTDYLLNTYSSDVVLNRHIDLFNQRIK